METPSGDTTRKCKKCHKTKPVIEFVNREHRCRDCYNKYNREWRAAQGKRYKDKQKKRWHDRLNAMSEVERLVFNRKMADKMVKKTTEMKEAVYNAYGGYVCACCGETEKSFLTIDHVNNDGAEHRKQIRKKSANGTQVYRWLIKNNFPGGFQVLCWNCQWGKVKNNGICPHRVTCNDYPVMGVGSSGPKHSVPLQG